MNIIGKSECTASQMAQYLIAKNPDAKSWALEYAQLYLEEGEIEGVRGDGAWIQSCKETGNFMFIGGTAVTFDQNNFCGLGVTRKGLKGHSFDSPRLGIRAQIQHLKGYATSTPLVNPCIDPRYKYVTKGCAPRFEDLAGKWAVPGYNTQLASSLQDAMNKGIGYGFDIINGIEQMKKIVINNTSVKDNVNSTTKNTNSPLVTYTKISPNKTSPRNHAIDTITIHCIVGQWTAKQGCDYFAATNRQCSANYVVGKDGSIGLSVDEKDRSWCSSNASNDHRAITIEVASDTKDPYTVTSKAYNALIELVADICKRNGINKLVWSTSKADRINRKNGCNMTVHRDFANKSCPGQYLYSRHGHIAEEVNKRLNNNTSTSTTPSTTIIKPTVKVNTTLNVRNKPNGTIVGKLTNGDNVSVFDYQNNWLKIGESRWVSADYISTSQGKVTTASLNIRSGAGTTFSDIGDLKNNEVVSIFDEKNGWYKVLSSSKQFGWVSSEYINLI